MNEISVFAPATVANVGCGFDVLGFALDFPGDEVRIQLKETPGVAINKITGDNGKLPKDPKKNTVGVSVISFLDKLKSKQGVMIDLHKGMPLGSGLGSSAASSVASVYGLNELFGKPLIQKELLECAMIGEKIACGSAHADNVAPSLYGGIVLIRSYAPLDVVKLEVAVDLYCCVVHPHIEIKTKDARRVLKNDIELKLAISQWGNLGGLIVGLLQGDLNLIKRSVDDCIVEPVRGKLIPGFFKVKELSLAENSLGCGISGSGPSIFSLAESIDHASNIGSKIQKYLSSIGIDSDIFCSKINEIGPRIL